MKTLFLFVLALTILSVTAVGQKKPVSQAKPMPGPARLSTFTLTGFYAEDGHGKLKTSEKAQRNCFDFVSESEVPCAKRWDIVYGSMRAGDEWDWFYVPANGNTRTRLKRLGKKAWSDIRELPDIEPLAKLKPGEKRAAKVDASGSDGADGAAGRDGAPGANGANGDGGGAPSAVPPPESGRIEVASAPRGKKPVTTNELFVKAVKGEMYVLRVVDDEHDFYVLMRVDDIVRGRTATISWKKFVAL